MLHVYILPHTNIATNIYSLKYIYSIYLLLVAILADAILTDKQAQTFVMNYEQSCYQSDCLLFHVTLNDSQTL